jgi:hypothetical protein
MSNQIVISSGAKVRSLEGVLTGTAGIVNSVPLGGANGVATLDALGKVPLSQLPASVVTYLGTWNASTNTPTLTNGVGDDGDLYICNVAGTVNFGAGPITFAVGDWVIYGSGTWQKSAGASGTVTSVAVTESGDALTITGSPITTSGTINIGFAGTSGQYVNGAGGLTTFPSLTGFVPYTGATANVDLGTFNLTADVITGATGSFASSGGSDTFAINHSSGSGVALNITKGGNGEGLYINKTSGSGNAATIIGTLNATTLVKNGGTSSQYLMADGSVSTGPDLTGYVTLATTQTITGLKSFDAALNLKVGAGAGGTGYIGLGSITDNTLVVYNTTSGTTYSQSLAFPTGAGNTYTFPNASGTIALTSNFANYVSLDGNQTIIGIKTFNNDTIFNGAVDVNNSINLNSGVFFRNNAVGSTLYTNFSILKSGSLETLTYLFTTANSSKLVFNDAANYTYTFPTINGTLALLEGTQTFTGAKTFSNNIVFSSAVDFGASGVAYFFGNASISKGLSFSDTGSAAIFANAQAFAITRSGTSSYLTIRRDNVGAGNDSFTQTLTFTNNAANRTYTFPDANGTLALTSNLSAYLPLTGGTLTGTLTVNNEGITINRGAGNGYLLFQTNGTDVGSIYSTTGGGVRLRNATSDVLTITSAGNVGIGTASPSSILHILDSSANNTTLTIGTTGEVPTIKAGGTNTDLQIESVGGGGFINLVTNTSSRMLIRADGNIGVGVNGDANIKFWIKNDTSKTYALVIHDASQNDLFIVRNDGLLYTGVQANSPYNYGMGGTLRALYVNNGGILGYNNSTRESKTNIYSLQDVSWIYNLNPVKFNKRKKDDLGNYTDEVYENQDYGLIADEVEAVNSDFVFYDIEQDGTKKLAGVEYEKLNIILLKAIQELNAKVSALENKV